MPRGEDLGPRPKRNNAATVRKKMKVEMLRYCQVWGYNDKQTIAYFELRGEKLSIGHYYDLLAIFNSDKERGVWYSEQALFAMEKTHKQSIEQLDELIKTTMAEIQQLQSTTVYINKGTVEDPKMVFNEEHDSQALAQMMKTLTDIIKTRDDMLAATPIVQAIMNKNALTREKTEMKTT